MSELSLKGEEEMNHRVFPVKDFAEETLALQMRAIAVGNSVFNIVLRAGLFQEKERRAVAYTMQHELSSVPSFITKVGENFPDEFFLRKTASGLRQKNYNEYCVMVILVRISVEIRIMPCGAVELLLLSMV